MELINKVLIQTNIAILDTDYLPKTDLYYDKYTKLINTTKMYRKNNTNEEIYDEILEINNINIINIVEY